MLARQVLAPLWTSGSTADHGLERPATVNARSRARPMRSVSAGGTVLGAVGNGFGTGAALAGGALLLTPALTLYARDPPRREGAGARRAPRDVVIRIAKTADDLDVYARVWSEILPHRPISGEEVQRRLADWDDGRRYFVAETDGVSEPDSPAARAPRGGLRRSWQCFRRTAGAASDRRCSTPRSRTRSLGHRRSPGRWPRASCRGPSSAASRRSIARLSSFSS